MKKIDFFLIAVLLSTILQSCDTFNPNDTPVPACEWDSNETYFIDDLQLKYPSDLSTWHENQIPFDRIERNLLNLLNNYLPDGGLEPKAKISVKLIASGDACTGTSPADKNIFLRDNYTDVGASSLTLTVPSNAPFNGEVTIGVRSDTFLDFSGNGNYYHVMWSGSGNNQSQIPGNLVGTKVSYYNPDGSAQAKVISKNGCYWENGQQICM